MFRTVVSYQSIGERAVFELTDSSFIETINTRLRDRSRRSTKELIILADQLTCEQLQFATNTASNNPNELVHTRRANCIGYAALFTATFNYLANHYQLSEHIKAQHHIGKLHVFGVDIHSFIGHPFFKDHDFNTVRDKRSGEAFAIDSSVSDYLRIRWVSLKK